MIYENKIKVYEEDLARIRSQAQTLLKSNNEYSYENEELKRADRDLQLTNELLQNQVQSLERQVGAKVIELRQHNETIQRQHFNYSSLLK